MVFGIGLPERAGFADLGHADAGQMPEVSVAAILSSAAWRCSSRV